MNEKQQIDEMALVTLNCFRNKYYTDGINTENGLVADSINAVLPVLVAIRNGEYRKQSEWISVDEPPEEYRDEYGELVPFLVCCKGTVYPFRAVYDGTNWGDGIGKLKVIHWMPLPEPPKGE